MLRFKSSISLVVFSIAGYVAADSLSLYTGDNCAGAQITHDEPLVLDTCYNLTYGAAESFVLIPDDGVIYGVYPDNRCSEAGGETSLEGCQVLTGFAGLRPMSAKKYNKRAARRRMREANPETVRDIGDTMVCPNSGYFLQASFISPTTGDLTVDEETSAEDAFEAAVDAGRPGATTVESEGVGDQGERLILRLRLTDGTVNQISPPDLDDIVNTLFVFRDEQRGPYEFTVNLYTGRPDTMASNIGVLQFVVE